MKYALTNATILTGKKDMIPQPNKSILIENGRITNITETTTDFGKIPCIDLHGNYLMPGLINLHVHLPGSGMPKDTKKQNAETVQKLMKNKIAKKVVTWMCQNYAKTELYSGVTTIRTVGGLADIDSQIRNKINKGKAIGPRMLVSNMAISVPGGHMAGVLAYEATSVQDCIKYVNEIAKDKPDWIKLMITGGVLDATVKGEPGVLRMKPELVKACCDEAHRLGFRVAAHVESTEGLRVALKCGVDTIEHGAAADEEIIELFKKRHASQICTISPAIPLAKFDPSISHATELTQYNDEIVLNGMIDCAKKALANEILVGLGTDTACPFVTHYDMWRELMYFQHYVGVSNAFSLHTATEVNATIAGISKRTGTVEVGKIADFLITEGNPLEDLRALRTPYMVVSRGIITTKPKIKKYDYVERELDKQIPFAD